MEGPHGQLCTRFANRLRRDNADRFAHIDFGSAREVAPVTCGANTRNRVAG